MNFRETTRYGMFGAAAALFVAGGLVAGQVLGASPIERAQAAAFQSFDYVSPKNDKPAEEPETATEPESDPTAASANDTTPAPAAPTTAAPNTGATGGNDGVATGHQVLLPKLPKPTEKPDHSTPAPTGPAAEPEAPAVETPEPEAPAPVEPEPEDAGEEPDAEEPEEPVDDDGPIDAVPIDPCFINPELPECDDDGGVTNPDLELHPCTFSVESCPGEEDEPILVAPIDPCLVVECEPEEPEVQFEGPVQLAPLAEPTLAPIRQAPVIQLQN